MDTGPAEDRPYAIVVDDEAIIRLDASDILEEAGFRTLQAADAEWALSLLAHHHASVTLLFTDVEMPGSRDGFALARETTRLYPHVCILVASGRRNPTAADLPAEARFVAKPFSAEVVHDRLRELLPDGRKPAPPKS